MILKQITFVNNKKWSWRTSIVGWSCWCVGRQFLWNFVISFSLTRFPWPGKSGSERESRVGMESFTIPVYAERESELLVEGWVESQWFILISQPEETKLYIMNLCHMVKVLQLTLPSFPNRWALRPFNSQQFLYFFLIDWFIRNKTKNLKLVVKRNVKSVWFLTPTNLTQWIRLQKVWWRKFYFSIRN